jgi:hypothetical protein
VASIAALEPTALAPTTTTSFPTETITPLGSRTHLGGGKYNSGGFGSLPVKSRTDALAPTHIQADASYDFACPYTGIPGNTNCPFPLSLLSFSAW